MTHKSRGRHNARVSSLLAGTVLVSVLAAPSVAGAQGTATPTGAGKVFYSDDNGDTRSVWANGTHDAPVGNDFPVASAVNSFDGTGTVLAFTDGGSAGYFKDVTSNGPDVTYAELNQDHPIAGVAGSPDGAGWVVSTDQGVFRKTANGIDTVYEAPAGRIAWSSEDANGTVVWDGYGVDSDPGIPGGGDLPSGYFPQESTGAGIWIWTPNGGAPVELVTDPSATNPSISQDGRIVAFEMASGAGNHTDIFYVDLDDPTRTVRRLGANTAASEALPAVAPDGTQIAYWDNTAGKLMRAATTTTSGPASQVANLPMGLTGVAWQPAEAAVAGSVTIDGTADVGHMLTAVLGTNSTGSGPIDEKIVWESCDDVASDGPDPSCSVVHDGVSAYTVKPSDAGKRIRAVRVATNPVGEHRSYSARTAVVPSSTPTDPTPTPTDTTGPGAPTITDAPGPFVDYRYPSFAWTPAEPGGTFECRVVPHLPPETGYAWAPCASPFKPSTPLESGEYVFEVRQIDAAHNPGEVARHAFTVDLDPPVQPTLSDAPEKTTTKTSATFAFSNPSNEVTRFECRLDAWPDDEVASRVAGPEWKTCDSPHVVDGLSVGKHQMEIRQVDRAGNHSSRVAHTWTVQEVPVVVPPVDEPETPKPVEETPKTPEPVKDVPVAETPKVETPKVEAPKAEAPKAEVPAPKAEAPKPEAPAKRPALKAVIGGTQSGPQSPADGGSSAATIEVAKEAVGVGCTITGTVLKSCKVDLYATVAVRPSGRASSRTAGTSAHASAATRQVLVGTGTYEQSGGASKMHVRVALNATGKALMRTSPGGLKVTVKITGRPVSGAPLKATGAARLVSDRAAATVGGFAVNSAQLTPAARRQLRVLAAFGKATTIRCVGHTDGSTDDRGYLRTLGARRAQAVCAYLAAHGVRGTRTLVSKGSAVPAATNATKAGRAQNRRVVVTIVR